MCYILVENGENQNIKLAFVSVPHKTKRFRRALAAQNRPQEAVVQLPATTGRRHSQTSTAGPVTENSEEVEGVTSLFVCFQDGAGPRPLLRVHGGI